VPEEEEEEEVEVEVEVYAFKVLGEEQLKSNQTVEQVSIRESR
jgi:hypothetical protein